jgi:hypothetical protein
VRTADGQLTVLGARPSGFVSEQWLRADADPRAPKAAHNAAQCDGSGCSAELPDGRIVALLQKRDALLDDCTRAALVIAPFPVPGGCAAAYELILHFADELQKIFCQRYAARRCTSLTAINCAPTFDLQPHFAILDGFHE